MRIVREEEFGPEHERLILFIETVCVEDRGYPDVRRMSCNPERHPERRTALMPDWKPSYSTTLRDGSRIDGHDDWDSIEDLLRSGLIAWRGTGAHPRFELTDKGWERAHALRRARAERSLRS